LEALQKPGFFPEIFREFLGGQVCVAASLSKDIRARKQTCLTTKLLQKDSFLKSFHLIYLIFCYRHLLFFDIFSLKFLVKIILLKIFFRNCLGSSTKTRIF
jgi:hypothetical protein